jgi:two-component system, chemotaxis family, protein-glutamate methylesterase/glutaminase
LALPFAKKLNVAIAPNVRLAEDGLPLRAGTVYIVADPYRHAVVDSWPGGNLRLVDRPPINAARPSADLLFATIAKTAGASAVAAVLTGMGEDGAAGLAALQAVGATTLCEDPKTAMINDAARAAIAKCSAVLPLPLNELSVAIFAALQLNAQAA